MLKQPINIDDFASFQNFTFNRRYVKGGEQVEDVMACKIRGVRTVSGDEASASYSDEWTRVVKIEGCDYKISEDMILSWLTPYGDIKSELVEDVFEDSEDSEGTNATGVYSVKMRLTSDIPQLLPMDGRRVKIYYRGIRKLCTSCFGKHFRKDCKKEKVQWIDYVREFVKDNPEVTGEQFGNWITILERNRRQDIIDKQYFESKQQTPETPSTGGVTSSTSASVELRTEVRVVPESEELQRKKGIMGQNQSSRDSKDSQVRRDNEGSGSQTKTNQMEPTLAELNIPEDDDELAEIIARLQTCGMTQQESLSEIERRRKRFNMALKRFTAKKDKQVKPRKNSLNDFQP